MAPSTARYLLLAFALAVVLTAVLAWPAHAWQGAPGLFALGAAAAICFVGALAGRGVGALMQGMDPSGASAPTATQAAIGARLVLTLALSLPVFIAKPFPMVPFVIWLGAHYLSQMALEVFVSLRELSQNHGPTGTPARLSQPEAELPSGSTAGGVEDAEGAARR